MGTWVGPLMAGLGALQGAFGQNQYPGANDPGTVALRQALQSGWQNRLNNQSGFQTAYTTGGLRNIAMAGNNEGNSVNDFLASRGLGRTIAGAGSMRDVSYDVGGRTSNFLNNVPLAMDQRNLQNLQGAGGFLNSMQQAPAQPSPGGAAMGWGANGLAGWLGAYYANKSLQNALEISGNSGSGNSGLH